MAKIPSKPKKSIIYWVRLRAYINKSVFGKILSEIEKIIKTFQFSIKFFSKIIYYCVSLRHMLVKSLYIFDMANLLATWLLPLDGFVAFRLC